MLAYYHEANSMLRQRPAIGPLYEEASTVQEYENKEKHNRAGPIQSSHIQGSAGPGNCQHASTCSLLPNVPVGVVPGEFTTTVGKSVPML